MAKHLSRRSILRGIAYGVTATILLPPLEDMMDSTGRAFADGTPLPRPVGTWFWGCGVNMARWRPTSMGSNWGVSEELQPLADAAIKSHVTIVTGFRNPFTRDTDAQDHYRGRGAMLSGSLKPVAGGSGWQIPASATFSEIAGNHHASQTRFGHLACAVSIAADSGYNATQIPGFNAEINPVTLFDNVFGMGIPQSAGPSDQDKARTAAMNALLKDGERLAKKLGANGRQQLQATLDGYNGILKRLQSPISLCPGKPGRPATRPTYAQGVPEPIEALDHAMTDILTVAVACDLTRAFTLIFAETGNATIFAPLGQNGYGHHQDNSHARDAAGWNRYHAAVTYTMGRLAKFAKKLAAVPMGAGTLLDQICLYGCSDLSDGNDNSHESDDVCAVVVGKAGGALKGNYHHRGPSSDSVTKLPLTLLKAAGVPASSFGEDGQYGPGKSTGTVPEILI